MPDNDIKLLAKDVTYIKKAVDDLRAEVRQQYVTRVEFLAKTEANAKDIQQLQKIIYTVIGFVGLGVLGLVLKNSIPGF